MKLLPGAFKRITSGKKTIEIRLFDEKRQKLNKGDIIEFSRLPNRKETIQVKVLDLIYSQSFSELIDTCGMESFGYSKTMTKEDYLEEIYKIYTKEQEKQYGVLGIKIELLKP